MTDLTSPPADAALLRGHGVSDKEWHDARMEVEAFAHRAQFGPSEEFFAMRDNLTRELAELRSAAARLRALADQREALDDKWRKRMAYLFAALPFPVRHRWGGDAREFVEGIDAAMASARRPGGGG